MVAIVLDSTFLVNETPNPTQDDEFSIMRETYAHLLDGTLKIPAGVLAAPHDGSVAVAVFMHGLQDVYINGSPAAAEERATQVIPWTVLSSGQATLFSDRLLRLPRWFVEGPYLDEALEVAEASVANWPPVDEACFRTIHLVTVSPNDYDPEDLSGDMAAARDMVVGSTVVERIDAFGVPRFDQDFDISPSQPQTAQEYFWNYAVKSDDGIEVAAQTANPPPPASYPGFEDPDFADLVSRLLKRVTYCPGDFNLDGEVLFDDYLDFLDAHGNSSHPDHARTDWDFSGGTPDQADIDLFGVAWLPGCCQ